MYNNIDKLKNYLKKKHVVLDKQKGLEYLGNCLEAYTVFVSKFLDVYQNANSEINEYLNNKNYEKLELIVHRLKGTLIYFGATDIYDFSIYLLNNIRAVLKNNITDNPSNIYTDYSEEFTCCCDEKKLDVELKIFGELIDLIIYQLKTEDVIKKIKGLIICNAFLNSSRFSILYEMLKNAFLEEDIIVDIKTNLECFVQIQEDESSLDYDFILFWDKDVKLAWHLQNLGFKVFNSADAIRLCDDKGLTSLKLENSGIKMPKTIFFPFCFENFDINLDIYNRLVTDGFIDNLVTTLGFPMIIKENNGSFGDQVYLVENIDELKDKILELKHSSIQFQEFIKSSFGSDCRVMVIGGKAVGAVKRNGKENDFRSNVLQGGTMEKFTPDLSFIENAEKVATILGLDFCGVDFMFGENGEPILCEVNSNVHFKTFSDVTGIDFSKLLVKHIKSKLNNDVYDG